MSKSQVNYPQADTFDGALALARSEGKRYATGTQKSERDALNRTTRAAFTVRAALATGLLYDARTVKGDRPESAKSKQEFAGYFSPKNGKALSPSQVSFWVLLSVCLDRGVDPESILWDCLAARSGAKRKGMGEAIVAAKNADDIATALQASGMDPETGERATTTNPTPRTSQGQGEEQEHEQPVSPFQAAKDALTAFHQACQSPTVQAAEWEVLRKMATDIVGSENRRRGTTKGRKPAAA